MLPARMCGLESSKFYWNQENASAIKQNFTIYFNLPDR